jgi:hypothetical protein
LALLELEVDLEEKLLSRPFAAELRQSGLKPLQTRYMIAECFKSYHAIHIDNCRKASTAVIARVYAGQVEGRQGSFGPLKETNSTAGHVTQRQGSLTACRSDVEKTLMVSQRGLESSNQTQHQLQASDPIRLLKPAAS